MHLLILIACAWVALFAFSLALAAANGALAGQPASPLAFQAMGVSGAIFPLVESEQSSRLSSLRTTRNRSDQTVYVVDDDPGILNLLREVLTAEGYDVRSFSDPEKALAEFEHDERPPQVLLTDYAMKSMNGLDLINRCRSARPDLKSIVISGAIDQDALGPLPDRSDRFISKPFAISSLLHTLEDSFVESHN